MIKLLDPNGNSVELIAVTNADRRFDVSKFGAQSGIPVGTIIVFGGAVIPTDWQVCDGTNGTPNLVDKLVRGTTDEGKIGNIGGTKDKILPDHTHTVTLTNTPNHTHSCNVGSGTTSKNGHHRHTKSHYTASRKIDTGARGSKSVVYGYDAGYTTYGGNHRHSIGFADISTTTLGKHTHTVTANSVGDNGDNMPPVMPMIYIMKMT